MQESRLPPIMGTLFMALAGTASTETAVRLPDPLEAGWKGTKVCEKLVEDDRHRLLRCVFPPGVGHERHFHAPHTGYVLEGGTMRLTDAEGVREVDVSAGATWTSAGIEWHEALNVGDTTSSYLVIEIKTPGFTVWNRLRD